MMDLKNKLGGHAQQLQLGSDDFPMLMCTSSQREAQQLLLVAYLHAARVPKSACWRTR